ncbi:hypothetical protein F5148DRAFT_1146308 [Russula earlei]|uniref:Uncharacterized protein n=1 Tax=Russula earlei TaxID=71964 RepID=A0ACC0UK66_9AGAM|nr:hypothetical protein F5148DRAFT_1146308 [Russula earlei]
MSSNGRIGVREERGLFHLEFFNRLYKVFGEMVVSCLRDICHQSVNISRSAEHGLMLFQTGEDAFWTGREMDGQAHGLGFTESAWGDKTWDLVKLTRKLQDFHWVAILGECSIFLHYHLQETEQEWCLAGGETKGFEQVRPHVHIDITW